MALPAKAVAELPRPIRLVIRRPWATWRRLALTPRQRRRLRRFLNRHGHITPNFTWAEAACNDGTPVPRELRHEAIDHAWRLEKFRHQMGDASMSPISWYRTPVYNARIGGASQSRHMAADATDFSKATVDRLGRSKFFATADRIWSDGGVGNYPSGSAHMDSRGYKARWTSF